MTDKDTTRQNTTEVETTEDSIETTPVESSEYYDNGGKILDDIATVRNRPAIDTESDWIPEQMSRSRGTWELVTHERLDNYHRKIDENVHHYNRPMRSLPDIIEEVNLEYQEAALYRKDTYLYGRHRHDVAMIRQEGTAPLPRAVIEPFEFYEHHGLEMVIPSTRGVVVTILSVIVMSVVIDSAQLHPTLWFYAATALMTVSIVLMTADIAKKQKEKKKHPEITEHSPQVEDDNGNMNRSFYGGTNRELAVFMRYVDEHAQGPTDPIWDLYEQVISLAEEGTLSLSDQQKGMYAEAVTTQVGYVYDIIDQRIEEKKRVEEEERIAIKEAETEVEEISNQVMNSFNNDLQDRLDASTEQFRSIRDSGEYR